MRFVYGNPIPNPCKKDCPDRRAGCAIACKAWADYREKRDKLYQERYQAKESEGLTRKTLRKQKEALRRQNNK